MLKSEKRFGKWFLKHYLLFSIVFATILSLYVRYIMRDKADGDLVWFLIPWYEQIQQNGGLLSLHSQVGDYGIPYQTIIALLTYIPIPAVYAYKLVSVLFDYLLGFGVGCLVFVLSNKNKTKGTLAYILTIYLPCVCFNSAMWGQCDSIFTTFCVFSLLFLVKEKYVVSFLFYGAALAFKLQAVFFLPFLLFIYVYEKRFSILHFLCVFPSILFLNMGGLIYGRTLSTIIQIYVNQTNTYQKMSMNYPSFWNLFVENMTETGYPFLKPFAVGLTVTVLLILMIWLFYEDRSLSRVSILNLAFIMAYTCVLFLPSMHDRYDYPYLVLAAALVILAPKTLPGFATLVCIGMSTYGNFLFGTPVHWKTITLINIACYLFYLIDIVRSITREDLRNTVPS